jgi:predicted restriction endonuclease
MTPLRRSRIAPASEEQRAKVAGQRCLVCGGRAVDPAHLVPRSLGGSDHPDCVVPLCRIHHRLYDRGELDLLPCLEPHYRAELAHGLRHIGLLALLRRVSGSRWAPTPTVGGMAREERGM